MPTQRIDRMDEGDEVARDEPGALMNQLVERVLAVGAWFAPIDRTGLVRYLLSVKRDMLAVAFHGQLLEVRRKAFEVLFVGQNSDGLSAKKVVVPDRQKTHD